MVDSFLKFLSDNPEYIFGVLISAVIFVMMKLNHKNNIELEDKRSSSEEKRAKNITDNHNEWQKFIEKQNQSTNDSVKELSNSVLALAQTVSNQSVETGEAVRDIADKISVIHTDITAHREEFRRFTDILDASRERRSGSHL